MSHMRTQATLSHVAHAYRIRFNFGGVKLSWIVSFHDFCIFIFTDNRFSCLLRLPSLYHWCWKTFSDLGHPAFLGAETNERASLGCWFTHGRKEIRIGQFPDIWDMTGFYPEKKSAIQFGMKHYSQATRCEISLKFELYIHDHTQLVISRDVQWTVPSVLGLKGRLAWRETCSPLADCTRKPPFCHQSIQEKTWRPTLLFPRS